MHSPISSAKFHENDDVILQNIINDDEDDVENGISPIFFARHYCQS